MYVLIDFVNIALSVLQLMMFARAILSWFPMDEENALIRFLYGVTEPIITPVRNFLSRFSFFQSIPIDISFIVVFMIISLVQTVLTLFR